MRNGQNNKRMRNRNNNNNNNNRRGQNPMTRVFESNGPDIKIRGTASHIAEKYLQLARDARSSGDPVAAENYYQHAEHYFRLIGDKVLDGDRGRPRDQQHQPREHREQRNQPQYQQPQPSMPDNGGVDRLPSFITGPQPQINGGAYEGNGGGGERFPRRRRRPHGGGPRPEGVAQPAAAAPSDDFNPGND